MLLLRLGWDTIPKMPASPAQVAAVSALNNAQAMLTKAQLQMAKGDTQREQLESLELAIHWSGIARAILRGEASNITDGANA